MKIKRRDSSCINLHCFRYNALTFIDECHATGFFGEGGRGTEMFFPGLEGKVDIINSTLGKALGGAAGGYTTAKKQIVNLLRLAANFVQIEPSSRRLRFA